MTSQKINSLSAISRRVGSEQLFLRLNRRHAGDFKARRLLEICNRHHGIIAENAVRIAKSALYPSLSLRGGYGTGIYSTQEAAFGTQFRKNSSEFVGVSMSVPIFNRRATHNSILSARIAMRKQQLAVTDAEQSLRKEIEQAWYNADAAYGKYRSADAALTSARVAFAYEQQKADAGRSTVFDFNDAKTRMEKAESELVQAKYEFVFRSKILDFYRGRPLEL